MITFQMPYSLHLDLEVNMLNKRVISLQSSRMHVCWIWTLFSKKRATLIVLAMLVVIGLGGS
jgi:hypothetical protein